MTKNELIALVRDEPLFTSGMLLSPGDDLRYLRKQLSRWVADGVVIQLKRGLYTLSDLYRRVEPHPYEISNALVPGSYVSLETLLADRGLIPEAVYVITAVTTGKQGSRKTLFGTFVYQHIKESLLWGYEPVDIGDRTVFVATPEKALLDLAYLRPGSSSAGFVAELRLQHLEILDMQRLHDYAQRFSSRKVELFARRVAALARTEREEYEAL